MTSSKTAVVSGIYIVRPQAPSLASSAVERIEVSLQGFEGDRHAGWIRAADSRTPEFQRGTPIRNNRQVTIVSSEELNAVAQALKIPHILPEWLGANLCLTGLPDLTRLAPLTRLFFSNQAVLVIEGENDPCRGPGKIIQAQFPDSQNIASRFVKAAYRKRGLIACVERAGSIERSEIVQIEPPHLH